jgi:hypothetical protein
MAEDYKYSGKVIGGSMDGRTVSKNDPPTFKKFIFARHRGSSKRFFEVYHWVSSKGTPAWRYSHDEPDTRIPEPDHDWAAIEQMQIDIQYLKQRLARAEDVIRNMYHNTELVPLADLIEYKQDYNFDLGKPDDKT